MLIEQPEAAEEEERQQRRQRRQEEGEVERDEGRQELEQHEQEQEQQGLGLVSVAVPGGEPPGPSVGAAPDLEVVADAGGTAVERPGDLPVAAAGSAGAFAPLQWGQQVAGYERCGRLFCSKLQWLRALLPMLRRVDQDRLISALHLDPACEFLKRPARHATQTRAQVWRAPLGS